MNDKFTHLKKVSGGGSYPYMSKYCGAPNNELIGTDRFATRMKVTCLRCRKIAALLIQIDGIINGNQ